MNDDIVLTDLQVMYIAEELYQLNKPELSVKVRIPKAALNDSRCFYFALEVPK